MRLIAGQRNILLTKLPVGYAEGTVRPQKTKKAEAFNPVIRRRKGISQ